MNLQKLFFAAVIVLSANAAFAQLDTNVDSHFVTINIPEVALLDLEVASGTTDITLAGTSPTEAGLPMTFDDLTAKNTNIWMNYSSIVGSTTEPLRNVSVQITDGAVPSGLKLTVLAGAVTSGDGTRGTASAVLTLTGSLQNIVTGVGSAYTETGANKGHQLTYQLGYATIANYAGLDFDSSATPLTITYTLSDI